MALDLILTARVGRNCLAYGGNTSRDIGNACAALGAIAAENGGTPGMANDIGALIDAIEKMQKRWWPATKPDGVMMPTGRTWLKVKALLGVASSGASSGSGSGKVKKAKGFKTRTGFYQGSHAWKEQHMNTSSTNSGRIWNIGCLLSALASALAAKELTIPMGDVAAVKEMVDSKNPGYAAAGRKYSEINPATLDAWFTLNNSQGYMTTNSLDLDPGEVRFIDGELPFWGRHSPDRTDYLKMPDDESLKAWVEAGWVLVVRRIADPNHFLWLNGVNADGSLSVWDPGYPPGDAHHTAQVTAADLDRVFRWGPLN